MRPLPRPALVALALVAACSSGSSHHPRPVATADDIAGVVHQDGLSHEHVDHAVTYPHHPPMGGPHWAPRALGAYGWQACAVYTEPVLDEFAVHSLEHGAVWLSYLPGTPADQVQQLATLARIRPDYALVSPYPGQPGAVIATAWGLQLTVTSAQDPRLAEFVRRYAGGGQGGEQGADCAHGSTIQQARDALTRSHS